MKARVLALTGLLYGFPALAATSNWVGPGSDFNTAANWDAGVPAECIVNRGPADELVAWAGSHDG